MLSDRPYMKREQPASGSGVLTWMLCALLAGFVVQNIFGRWMGSPDFERLFALSTKGARDGYLWSFLTYVFLHGGVFHLAFNALGLFFLGRELVPMLGSRRFLGVSAAAASVGGLAWFATHFLSGGGLLVGASAVVLGLFIVFACFHPDREITFLLFFVLPVTLRPRIAAWILLGLDGLGFLFSELPGNDATGIAHSAHLGGMLVGWIYYRYLHANNGWDRAPSLGMEMPGWWRRRKAVTQTTAAGYTVNVTPKAKDLRAEVDRVLDKINSQGFGALTDEEKRILDEAKDMLSRR